MIIELRGTRLAGRDDGVGDLIAAWQLKEGHVRWIGKGKITEFAQELASFVGVPEYPRTRPGEAPQQLFAVDGLEWIAAVFWQHQTSSRMVVRCYDGEGTLSVPIQVNGEWKMVAMKDYEAGRERGIIRGSVMLG